MISMAGSVSAQNYKMDWYVIACGGGTGQSKSYVMSSTVGQPVAGSEAALGAFHWIGFWTSGRAPAANALTITDAKGYGDGQYIQLTGTATSDAGDFSGVFYIEDDNRLSGMRIEEDPTAIVGLIRGCHVTVSGFIETCPTGERKMIPNDVSVTP